MYRRFQGIFLVSGDEVMQGELSMEEFVMGEENLNEKAAGFFSIFLKHWKNKYEKVSSTETKELH